LEHIRDAVRMHRTLDPGSPQVVLDTTAARSTVVAAHGIDRARSLPPAESKGNSSFRLSHLLRPFHDSFPLPLGRAYSAPDPPNAAEEYTHISKRGSFVPVATSTSGNDLTSPVTSNPVFPTDPSLPLRDHTYPPSSSPGESSSSHGKILPLGVPWNVGVPSWLRSARRITAPGGSMGLTISAPQNLGSVHEIYSSPVTSSFDQSNGVPADLGYSVLETTEAMVDGEIMEKFRTAFAFDDKEVLLACMHLPITSVVSANLVVRLLWLSIQASTRFGSLICVLQLLLFQVHWSPQSENKGKFICLLPGW